MPSLLDNSLFEDMSGVQSGRALTVEGFVANLAPAALSCGINGIGGLLAGRLDAAVSTKEHPGAGPFVVAAVAISLKAGFHKLDALDNIVRELASGMAGWVGSDVWFAIKNWWAAKKWEAMKSYSKGDKVKFDGKIYEASADIPYGPPTNPQAEPGKDSKWVLAKSEHAGRAQGFQMEDLRQYAQAFVSDPRRVDAIASDVAELAVQKGDVDPAHKSALYESLKGNLNQVIGQFAS